jgi:hypothetical protein
MRSTLMVLGLSLIPALSEAQVRHRETLPIVSSLTLSVRESFPLGGDVETSGTTGYDDIFNPGTGLSLEGDLMFCMDPYWRIGGFLSFGWDRFPGKSDTDIYGDSLKPDAMQIYTILVGFKSHQEFGAGFFWEGSIGLGAAIYNDVNATFVISGVPHEGVELFQSSAAFAFDLGARFGYGTPSFAAMFGLGYRIQGGPDRGRDVTSYVDPEPLATLSIDLSVRIIF